MRRSTEPLYGLLATFKAAFTTASWRASGASTSAPHLALAALPMLAGECHPVAGTRVACCIKPGIRMSHCLRTGPVWLRGRRRHQTRSSAVAVQKRIRS